MRRGKSIGGYLGLELSEGKEFYSNAIKLNSGRNGLEYILRAQGYSKIYIPYFTCDAVLQPVKKLNITYEFYSINEHLEPIFNFQKLKTSEAFLYTNYFGLKSDYIKNRLQDFRNVIIDNAQAFFSKPVEDFDTFYSPRKFFGVPDGGYVFTREKINLDLRTSNSYNRTKHLVKQIDVSIEEGYGDYLKNEDYLNGASLKNMSFLSEKILQAVDYCSVSRTRIENFTYLKNALGGFNRLKLTDVEEAPLNYPLFLNFNCSKLKDDIIKNNIYVPTYWNNVLEWLPRKDCLEIELINNMIHLPIDQRYNLEDMRYLVKTFKEIYNKYE